jgi:hypothetical protein
MLIITPHSHLDHGLSAAHLEFINRVFGKRDGFFAETVEMPSDLPELLCGLYGPVVGDAPIHDCDCQMRARFGRQHKSRIYIGAPNSAGYAGPVPGGRLVYPRLRGSRLLTVIAGPYSETPGDPGFACMLYTAFGGPLAPKEPGDPAVHPDELDASVAFWRDHALVPGSASVEK